MPNCSRVLLFTLTLKRSGKIGSAAYLAAVNDQQVTLNPRFGVLDPTQKTIITDQSASLAEPAPTQTP